MTRAKDRCARCPHVFVVHVKGGCGGFTQEESRCQCDGFVEYAL